VNPGTEYLGNDFGVNYSGTIGDRVWLDANGDGVQDTGEPGLAGVTVELYDSTGNTFIQSLATNNQGLYQFNGLADGNYVVRVITTAPAGMTDTTGIEYSNSTVTNGGDVDDRDFGFQPEGTLFTVSGTVFEDNGDGAAIAADGILSGTEPGIPNVTVTLVYTPSDGSPTTVVAPVDANGVYTVAGIPGGSDVAIRVNSSTLPNSAYQPTSPTVLTIPTIELDTTDQDFGFLPEYGSISGSVCASLSGLLGSGPCDDSTEQPLLGVTVTLTYAGPDGFLNTNDDAVITTPTSITGFYSFDDLLPGLYQIVEIDPADYISLGDRDGSNPNNIAVTLGLGENKTRQNFEDAPASNFEDAPASNVVEGTVYLDNNGNGIFDAGDTPMPNVSVIITDSLGVTHTVFTNDNGYYSQTVPAGLTQVLVDENDPDFPTNRGLTPNDPNNTGDNQNPGSVNVPANGVGVENAGYLPPTVLTGVVTDAVTGQVLPGAIVTVTDSGGHVYTTIADVNGRYVFTGTLSAPLDPGAATVTASAPGYDVDIQSPTIVAGTINIQDLQLSPTRRIDITATPACILGVPHLQYSITPVNFTPGDNPITIRWLKVDDNGILYTYTGQPLSQTMLWPEAAKDSEGRGLQWPGWSVVDGELVYVGSLVRPQVKVQFEVNPDSTITVDYPQPRPGCVTEPQMVKGTIFIDEDGDGVYTPGVDTPLPNIMLSITPNSGTPYTVTTDSNGAYSQLVPAGEAVVKVDDSSLPQEITLSPGSTDPTSIMTPPGGVAIVDVGYTLMSELVNGTIYIDENGDGVYTPGVDTPLPGVSIVITDSVGVSYTVMTDASGYYSQTVPAGETVVDVDDTTLPAGVGLTLGSTDPTTVVVPPGGAGRDDTGYARIVLGLAKFVSPGQPATFRLGDDVRFTIVFTNASVIAVRDVVVTEHIPDGLIYSPNDDNGWTLSPDGRTATKMIAGPVGPNTAQSIDIVMRVDTDQNASIVNIVTVNTLANGSGEMLPDPDVESQFRITVDRPTSIEPGDEPTLNHFIFLPAVQRGESSAGSAATDEESQPGGVQGTEPAEESYPLPNQESLDAVSIEDESRLDGADAEPSSQQSPPDPTEAVDADGAEQMPVVQQE